MNFIVTLNFVRSTKGTHLYATTDPNALVTNVYVKKSFANEPPATITLSVSAG